MLIILYIQNYYWIGPVKIGIENVNNGYLVVLKIDFL